MRSSTCGQIEVRRGSPAADPLTSPADVPSSERSATGTTTSSSTVLLEGGWTTTTSRVPPRNRATSSTGRTVADSPIRRAGRSRRASRRSRESARWAPRLVPATAWTSSTMTVSTPRRASRDWAVRSRNNDSGVVMSTSGRLAGEPASLVGRGVAGADGHLDVRQLGAQALRRLPDAGQRGAKVALDVDGERLERGDVEDPAAVQRVLRRRAGGDPVEGPQERREGLAGAGRRDHEGVLPGGGRVARRPPAPRSVPRRRR